MGDAIMLRKKKILLMARQTLLHSQKNNSDYPQYGFLYDLESVLTIPTRHIMGSEILS